MRTNIGSILNLAMLSKSPRKPAHPNNSTKSTLPLRKVRSFCQIDRSTFFWPTSPTLDGLWIREYKRNDLAEDSDDEKKITQVEAKACTQDKQNSARIKMGLASNRREPSVLSPVETAISKQFYSNSARPGLRPNQDLVLLVTSQDIGGHSVLSTLPSFSLLNE